MQIKQLSFLLITLAFFFPTTAISGEIDVQAGDVKVRTNSNGSISVDTSNNRVSVPPRSRYPRSWWQRRPYYYRHRSRRYCNNSTYQRSTQTTSVNGQVQTNSISTSTCR